MLPGIIVVGKHIAAVLISFQRFVKQYAEQFSHIHFCAVALCKFFKNTYPRVQIGRAVVTVHHRHRIAARRRHDIQFFIGFGQIVLQHRHTKDGKYRNEDITITNNTLTCSSKNKAAKIAITCIGINNLTVKNNTVKGPYQFAMHVMVADGVVIEGNQADGMKKNGIMVDSGKNVVISNNTLKNIAKHGISIGGGTVKKVSGNKITNVKWNGISVDDGKVTSITGNTISKAKKHGISIIDIHGKADCSLKNISNNNISSTGENGICINKAKVTNVNGNTLKTINKSGIVLIAGSIGSGKSRTKGVQGNTITGCKQHGIVAMSGTISSIGKNKISNMGVNGISLSGNSKVYYIIKNNIKKCKRNGIFNGSTYTKIKMQGNTGQK